MQNLKVLTLQIAIILIAFAKADVRRLSIFEKEALVNIYHANGGENWVSNDNWLTGDPVRKILYLIL